MIPPRRNAEARPGLGVASFVAFALAFCGCEASPPAPAPLRWGGETMGTTYTVAVAADADAVDPKALALAVEDELAAVNRQMSTWDAGSELSRFNAAGTTDWFPVSPDTAAVTALALEIAADSGGAFDPTVGPLVDLWGFGDAPRPTRVPSEDDLTAARAVVGYSKLHVRTNPPALRKDVPGLRVNLSAVAKGHGVDRVAARLEHLGVTEYLVEIGGEQRAGGVKAGDQPWIAGVERPSDAPPSAGRSVWRAVPLAGSPSVAAVATSGNYRNFYMLGGETVVHTIDPRTGRPVPAATGEGVELASATVLAADCATADALATAVMVLGPDEGRDLLERRGAAGLLIVRAGGRFGDVPTAEFRRAFGER